MTNSSEHKAVEKWSVQEALQRLPAACEHARNIVRCLGALRPLTTESTILDVGASNGRFLVACAKLGCKAYGIEPWDQARQVAVQLAADQGVKIEILPGVAEDLPFDDGRFDVVHCASVIEHVRDSQAAFNEACRVLKPGGVFWFFTVSSMCPKQDEIRGFPLFGWYPDRLKRQIMLWARNNRPQLVGHTETPAMHWFTPRKARRMLRSAGFVAVYDRWDLARTDNRHLAARLALKVIRSCFVAKLVANVVVSGCAYAAVKGGGILAPATQTERGGQQ